MLAKAARARQRRRSAARGLLCSPRRERSRAGGDKVHVARRKDASLTSSVTSAMFTGQVSGAGLSDQSTAKQLFLRLVRFSPGGRTVWHTHSFEQGLVIVEGKGIVATEAQENVVGARGGVNR